MAVGPKVLVEPQQTTPTGFGLLQTATVTEQGVDPQGHWRNGVIEQPYDCVSASATCQPCLDAVEGERDPEVPQTKDTGRFGQRTIEADPFTVYAFVNCSASSYDDETFRSRVATNLVNGEGRIVEEVLWTGDAGGCEIFPQLADPEVDLVTILGGGLALSPVAALGALEDAYGSCYPGIPTYHVPRGGIPALDSAGLLRAESGRLRTILGSLVSAGGGYPGTDVDDVAPPDGAVWIFGSGQVSIRRSEVFWTGGDRAEWTDREVNNSVLIAERTYVVSVDDCCRYAVLMDLNGCCC